MTIPNDSKLGIRTEIRAFLKTSHTPSQRPGGTVNHRIR